MTSLFASVTFTAVLAALSVICQTTGLIFPGWLTVESKQFSLNMALWFVVFCQHRVVVNSTNTTTTCEKFSYGRFFAEMKPSTAANLMVGYESQVGTQIQVTSCWLLALLALLLLMLQWRTLRHRSRRGFTIYEDEPRGTCNSRAKFQYSGGFAAIFQMFSGVLLSLVIVDFSKKYHSIKEPRPSIPYTLLISGAAVVCSALCSVIQMYIVFHVRENPPRQRQDSREETVDAQQKIPMSDIMQGAGHASDPEARHSSMDNGEYMFGLEYSNEGPPLMYRTQGTRKPDKPAHPFPGYKLAKQNMKGHDKKWWSKVTFASVPYL
ncbi:hypothetical protein MAR_029594 [Mya arenaria]|uniref:Uncharacterized protein n=1 Tax=Mya arenaria TaxID=6604 RepID=A0ABY7DK84_MYAAR|nr:uncharacterized protein LOC128244948 [Mya arenaria]WAQ96904.1 hypothetical protein MAR_029594 [Mya arenaria]